MNFIGLFLLLFVSTDAEECRGGSYFVRIGDKDVLVCSAE